jgi:hypothetical protein
MSEDWQAGDEGICFRGNGLWLMVMTAPFVGTFVRKVKGPKKGQKVRVLAVHPSECRKCGTALSLEDWSPTNRVDHAYDSCEFRKLPPYEATDEDKELIEIMKSAPRKIKVPQETDNEEPVSTR